MCDYCDMEAWLIAQDRLGRSHGDIARQLQEHSYKQNGEPDTLNPTTVGRWIRGVRAEKKATPKMRRTMSAFFGHEADRDAYVEENQVMFLRVMDALDEWQALEAYEAEQELIAHERRVAADNAFRARQEEVRRHARTVNRRMQDMGIVEKGSTYVYGDGAALIREGAVDFHYQDENAEIVGYAPAEYRFSGGLTAGQYREGVTREQRMRPSAVPAGQPRPEMIGTRRASLIPDIAHFDDKWFFGHLYADVSAWYELRDAAPAWWKLGGELPQEPGEEDNSWYKRVLELEITLLESGLVFEESVLGWGDDWATEVEEKREALLTMQSRRARIDRLAARRKSLISLMQKAFRLVGWCAAVLGRGAIGLAVGLAISLFSLLVLITIIVVPAGFVVTVDRGLARLWEAAPHAAEWFLTSYEVPLAGIFLFGVVLLFSGGGSGRTRKITWRFVVGAVGILFSLLQLGFVTLVDVIRNS